MTAKQAFFAAVGLVAFGSVTRILLQDLPNVETITVVALLAGAFLGGRYALVVPLAVVAISDISIGNSSILWFTWSAWALIGGGAWLVRSRARMTARFTLELTAMGIGGAVFFYLWTNLGVWAMYDFYAPGVSGLLASYVAGLPFLKYQMLGNIVIVPIVSGSVFLAVRAIHRFRTLRHAAADVKETRF